MLENPSANFNALRNSYGKTAVFRPSLSSLSFMGEAVTKMRASSSPRVSTFLLYTSLFVQPHKKSKEWGL
jgi:hypothetical protein